MEHIFRKQIKIVGIVQGVGFRPFVAKIAYDFSLVGFVQNIGDGVLIEIEGELKSLNNFLNSLKNELPVLSRIDKIQIKDIKPKKDKIFNIKNSTKSLATTMLPADISLCKNCQKEMEDKTNRRYMYPFINCVDCGARYTIIKKLPYDRKNTSMSNFTMCKNCQDEYEEQTNRRYHAQPISCFDCGPKLCFIENGIQNFKNPLEKTIEAIKDGKIVAIKGLGGFHIVCDAFNDNSVSLLRERKKRVSKPFAVMFKNTKDIKKYFDLKSCEEDLINSLEKPITIIDKRSKNINLFDKIAPNINKIGLFVPYTPLHKIILQNLQNPIVATSANLSDEPIITNLHDLQNKLSFVIDAILDYDRDIVNGCDDSVLAMLDNSSHITYRLARGFAPKSFYLKEKSKKKILSLGANQKSTVSIIFDNHLVVSPHIGDLNSIQTIEYFDRTIKQLQDIYNFKPDVIVCDKHSDYESTKWAKRYISKNENTQLLSIQHHYAHTLSVMAEYGLEKEVLSFSFDGTGLGDDGTIWGAEVFLTSLNDYKRVMQLQNISLLGGQKAIKDTNRLTLATLFEIFDFDKLPKHSSIKSFSDTQLKLFYNMYKNNLNSPKSSSFGRLFDAIYHFISHDKLGYEGESGLLIESYASKSTTTHTYEIEFEKGIIKYEKMIKEMLYEKDKSYIAKKFLNTVVKIITSISQKYEDKDIVVCGGVFQNTTILNHLIKEFKTKKQKLYIQKQTAINDGSISVGQVYFAYKKYLGEKNG